MSKFGIYHNTTMANSHIYKQSGNAVSVPVIKRIAENFIHALNTVYSVDVTERELERTTF